MFKNLDKKMSMKSWWKGDEMLKMLEKKFSIFFFFFFFFFLLFTIPINNFSDSDDDKIN